MKPIKDLDIVVALAKRGDKILMLQRKDPESAWDKKWEFPGGKIDKGESPEEALKREFLEETSLDLQKSEFLGLHVHDWDFFDDKILRVHINCFLCDASDGDVIIEKEKAHSHVWVDPESALGYDMLEANADIIKKFILEV